MSAATCLYPTTDNPDSQPRLKFHCIKGDLEQHRQKEMSERVAHEAAAKILDEIEDSNTRRDMTSASTWDFFALSTRQCPLYGGNWVQEASSSWDFGQMIWDPDYGSAK